MEITRPVRVRFLVSASGLIYPRNLTVSGLSIPNLISSVNRWNLGESNPHLAHCGACLTTVHVERNAERARPRPRLPLDESSRTNERLLQRRARDDVVGINGSFCLLRTGITTSLSKPLRVSQKRPKTLPYVFPFAIDHRRN